VRKGVRQLEKGIEQAALRKIKKRWPRVQIRKLNGFGFRSWPDRMFFFPQGVLVLMEFKRPGEYLTPAQSYITSQLRNLGYHVYVCDNAEEAVHICACAIDAFRTFHAAKLPKKKHQVLR
jgi:hypothetical protein